METIELCKPLLSLIGKSEKAQQKLAPGTWQHAMLRDNLEALHIGHAMMGGKPTGDVSHTELTKAQQSLASMIAKAEGAQAKFSPGTSQHTLLKNRIAALQMAAHLIAAALKGDRTP